jgi:PAS domain S-box-containing protein
MNRIGLEMIEAESLDQVRDHCVYTMVSEEHREAFKTLTQDVFKGKSGTLEFKMIGMKGRPLWLFTKVVPLRNEKGEIVLALSVTIDITKRKKMEEALKASEDRYRRITEAITDYIYIVRIKNGRPFETKHSEACVAVTGFTSREFAEDPYLWIKMVREEDHDLVRKQAEEVLSGKTHEPIEHRIIRKDGSMRWVESAVVPHYDMNGVLISYDGIVKDITERKLSEENIRKSETRLNEAQHQGKMGDWETDIATNVLSWSDEVYAIFGMNPDRNIMIKVDDFISKIHPNDRQRVQNFIKESIDKAYDSWKIEYRIILDSGEEKHIFVSALVEKNDEGKPVRRRGIVQDITERKQAEEALRISEEKFKALSEQSITGNCLIQDGKFIYVNPRLAEIFAFSQDEMIGLTVLDLVVERDRDMVTENIRKRMSGEISSMSYTFSALKKDGSEVPMEVYGSVMLYHGRPAIMATLLDITERKKAEDALIASEKKFRDLLENIQLIAVILDLNGNIIFCNDYLLRLTGWLRDETIGRSWFDIFLPEDVRGYVKSVFRANIARGTMLNNENPIVTRQGTLRQIVWNIAVLHDSDGNIAGTASIGIDVTEHRMLEEQLRQAQKMESVGHLAGGIAHDFNNILSAIVGYAHLTLLRMKDNDLSRVNIEHILAASGRAASLIQSLLAFSRKQIILLKLVDINEIIYDIKTMLSRIIGEDIDFKADTAVKRLIVKADKSQIEQALMNLATNARDAMPHGGILTISAEEVEIDGRFIQMHQFGEPGRYAVITVADTGVGMDEKTKKNIFEPFFTTKEVGKGTGLGLAMVYGAIKQHNGYINVYSEPGKGTTFKIYLPLTGSDEQPAEKKGTSTVSSGSETILLVEDEETVRVIMRSLLEESGYRVLEAMDGEDGLRLFKENSEKINLILSDIIMPKIQGPEMYEEIKKIAPDIKIIFISGYPADFIDQKSFSEKEKDIIDKPVIPDELLRKIREVLDN